LKIVYQFLFVKILTIETSFFLNFTGIFSQILLSIETIMQQSYLVFGRTLISNKRWSNFQFFQLKKTFPTLKVEREYNKEGCLL